jgi:hypothetical protein
VQIDFMLSATRASDAGSMSSEQKPDDHADESATNTL